MRTFAELKAIRMENLQGGGGPRAGQSVEAVLITLEAICKFARSAGRKKLDAADGMGHSNQRRQRHYFSSALRSISRSLVESALNWSGAGLGRLVV
jgi:hypothetical protein